MNEAIIHQLWQAADERKTCRITMKGEPLPRVIEPYGICQTSANKIVLVCCQRAGFTRAGGKAGYRNLLLENIAELEILDKRFSLMEDFNPQDPQYKDWVFHI